MNELIIQFLKIAFAKAPELTIQDVLILHFHKNFRVEMYHKGLTDKYGLHEGNIYKSYKKLRDNNYITHDGKTIIVKPKGKSLFNGKLSKKVAYHVLKDVREKWFEKLWKLYPIKIRTS